MAKEAWFLGSHDLVNLLYIPYTLMVLAYVIIGAMFAVSFSWFKLSLLLLAYFFGLGFGCHALDELKGRGLRTKFSDEALRLLAAFGLTVGIALGAYASVVFDPKLLLFVAAGTFFALAYNLEWFQGFFHRVFWFAVSWGGLPFLTSYYLNSGTITIPALLMFLLLSLTAAIQGVLSRWCKQWRRNDPIVSISFLSSLGEPYSRPETTENLLHLPQLGLKLDTYLVYALAGLLAVAKLL